MPLFFVRGNANLTLHMLIVFFCIDIRWDVVGFLNFVYNLPGFLLLHVLISCEPEAIKIIFIGTDASKLVKNNNPYTNYFNLNVKNTFSFCQVVVLRTEVK